MNTPSTTDDDAFVTAFLRQLFDDRSSGTYRTLQDYEGLFPGREPLIRAAWKDLESGALGDTEEEVRAPVFVPRRLGPYRLVDRLGGGGQGEVFLAEDTRLGRHVAIKVLRGWDASSEELRERFRREAHVASKLDHPGICPVYDVGSDQSTPYIVMKHLPGETLNRMVARRRRSGSAVPVPRCDIDLFVGILERVAVAVHRAHEVGVLHRDLKPANIMVSPGGDPVILDFGIARMVDGEASIGARTGDVFGTPSYVAPELLGTPPGAATFATDVYALGVTLFEIITGRRPYEAPTRDGLYRTILTGVPDDPRKLNPAVSRDLAAVTITAMERDPRRRYQSAEGLAEDLQRIREGVPVRAHRAGRLHRAFRWICREPAKAGVFGLLLMVAALGGFLASKWPDLRAQSAAARQAVVEDHLERGFLLLGEGDDGAEAEFEAALAQDPASAEAVAGKAMALLRSGRAEEALVWIDEPDAAAIPEADRGRMRVEILRDLRRESEAEAAARVLPSVPTSLGDFIAARQEMNRGYHGDVAAFDRAADLVLRCILGSRNPRAYHYFVLAEAAGRGSRPTLGAHVSHAISTRWGASLHAKAFAGVALLGSDAPRAVTLLEAACLQNPGHSVWCWLGDAQRSAGELAAAAQSYREVLRRRPRHLEALTGLAAALAESGETAEAVGVYEKTRALYPAEAGVVYNLGCVHLSVRDFGKAKEAFSAAVALNPQHAGARCNLGITLQELGDWDAAKAEMCEALRLRPNQDDYRLNLASIRLSRGDAVGALDELRAVGSEARRLLPALRIRGRSLRVLGRLNEAVEAFGLACAAHPRSAPAQADLGETHMIMGNFSAAVEAFRQTLGLLESDGAEAQGVRGAITRCEAFVELESVVKELRDRTRTPDEVVDATGVAAVAATRGLPVMAADLWVVAFRKDPSVESDLTEGYRFRAALCAALASEGRGEDGAALDVPARARWRGQALAWLEQDLRAWKSQLDTTQAREARARAALQRYREDPALGAVRDPSRLALLPDSERGPWQAFWREALAVLSAISS